MAQSHRDLWAVVTLAEAARRWNRDRKTIYLRMIAGDLDYRKSEGTWLITTMSLIDLWGAPTTLPRCTSELDMATLLLNSG